MELIKNKSSCFQILLSLSVFGPFLSNALPSMAIVAPKVSKNSVAEERKPLPLTCVVKTHHRFQPLHPLTTVAEEGSEMFVSERLEPQLSARINRNYNSSEMNESKTLLNDYAPEYEVIVHEGPQLTRSNGKKGWFNQDELSGIFRRVDNEVGVGESALCKEKERQCHTNVYNKKQVLSKIQTACRPVSIMDGRDRFELLKLHSRQSRRNDWNAKAPPIERD